MAAVSGTQPVLVSLEDHLAHTLRPLLTLLPEPLAEQLIQVLDNAPPTPSPGTPPPHGYMCPPLACTISYDLLAAISKWSRSPAGQHALASHQPLLPAQDYSIVALLAGARTSPDRKFPHLPTSTAQDEAAHRRELGDRRAVTAVLNALLSIIGSGLATWWAAGRLAWRDEWKVLLALFAAIIVACSEGILYLIWEDRRAKRSRSRRPLRFARTIRQADKKRDSDPAHEPLPHSDLSLTRDPAVVSATSTHVSNTTLRERTVGSANEVAGQNQ
ncbi:hypothetical protein L226DRAFT_377631 [Lentinus tigrinus ALCF2SS1-7]|uniref:Endoplasmic reticulum-based factor for assembly of V-ATPase n=1 Tax=Lentinus tigrinus ALCF2SS1-6 TaxID=1328759 RepID=A0A5C2SK81_9APHY|nr:hypothetical protein L227DRAFT_607956 [Lentinus tigrinus ALCF2SS1-6]RPD76474.1 hypothetical protein L226DRAFT_377631 [Lentinus tigrinus ALCF2SS1-7]